MTHSKGAWLKIPFNSSFTGAGTATIRKGGGKNKRNYNSVKYYEQELENTGLFVKNLVKRLQVKALRQNTVCSTYGPSHSGPK